MVHDVVEQNLDAEFVCISDERLVFAHRSHVVIGRVEVDNVIAVIVRIRVLPYRGEPDRRDTEVVQVGQMLTDAAQIAAVIGHRLGAIGGSC